MMVGKAGQLLDRSIVDRTVGAAERLVFEGAPIIKAPLEQSLGSRQPRVQDRAILNTVATCPPLTVLEQARLKELTAREAHRLAPGSIKARDAFVIELAGKVAQRTGIPRAQAVRIVERQCAGILLPHVALRTWMMTIWSRCATKWPNVPAPANER